jgi:hypothetical protein
MCVVQGSVVAASEDAQHGGQLLLLKGITGSFRPGVLTALMGASGAGEAQVQPCWALCFAIPGASTDPFVILGGGRASPMKPGFFAGTTARALMPENLALDAKMATRPVAFLVPIVVAWCKFLPAMLSMCGWLEGLLVEADGIVQGFLASPTSPPYLPWKKKHVVFGKASKGFRVPE